MVIAWCQRVQVSQVLRCPRASLSTIHGDHGAGVTRIEFVIVPRENLSSSVAAMIHGEMLYKSSRKRCCLICSQRLLSASSAQLHADVFY